MGFIDDKQEQQWSDDLTTALHDIYNHYNFEYGVMRVFESQRNSVQLREMVHHVEHWFDLQAAYVSRALKDEGPIEAAAHARTLLMWDFPQAVKRLEVFLLELGEEHDEQSRYPTRYTLVESDR